MDIKGMCQDLAVRNNMIVNDMLMHRGLTSLRDIPNYDGIILDTTLAYNIAVTAHAGAVDKGGNPYIEHPIAVASQFTCTYRASVGYLHDVVEDNSKYTFLTLKDMGIHPRVIQALKVLTHKTGSYDAYIRRVATDPIAIDVKIADILNNSNLSRLTVIDDRVLKRMKRYNEALGYFALQQLRGMHHGI